MGCRVTSGTCGAIIALAATASQLLVGLLVLLNLGPLAQSRLMGGDLAGHDLRLALSVFATFALLHRLASATCFQRHPRATRRNTRSG